MVFIIIIFRDVQRTGLTTKIVVLLTVNEGYIRKEKTKEKSYKILV